MLRLGMGLGGYGVPIVTSFVLKQVITYMYLSNTTHGEVF